MNKFAAEKWLTLGFLLTCGVVLAVLGFKLFTHQRTQTPQTAMQPGRIASSAGHDQWVLLKDQSLTIGDLKITYRGIARGEILLDVTLLQLDPYYAYRKSFPREPARRGVQLGQRFFKVAAVRGAYLKLVPLTGNPI